MTAFKSWTGRRRATTTTTSSHLKLKHDPRDIDSTSNATANHEPHYRRHILLNYARNAIALSTVRGRRALHCQHFHHRCWRWWWFSCCCCYFNSASRAEASRHRVKEYTCCQFFNLQQTRVIAPLKRQRTIEMKQFFVGWYSAVGCHLCWRETRKKKLKSNVMLQVAGR